MTLEQAMQILDKSESALTKSFARTTQRLVSQGIFVTREKKNGIFEEGKIRDNIKNQWCKENQITLIRIPYTCYDTLNFNDLSPNASIYIYH